MKAIKVGIVLVSLGFSTVWGQGKEVMDLSLQNCLNRAVEKNINIVQSRMDNKKSSYKVSESWAPLLPQVHGTASYQDNLKMSKMMLPGELMGIPGTYFPVTMGTEYNANVSVGVNQVLYNQTAITGLRLSKKSEELSRLSIEKAEESIVKEVTNLYFLSQTTDQQLQILRENIGRNEKIAEITKVVVDNGFGKKVDHDRIIVSIENQYTQLSNTEALHQQQLNMLKYILEIPIENEIKLTGNVSRPLILEEPTVMTDFKNHIDMRLLNTQKDMAKLNEKLSVSGYLPSLVFAGQWGVTGMRNEFNDFFHGGDANKWFDSYSVGLSLSVPIFDGLEKRSKYKQAKIDYDKSVMLYDNTQNKMGVNYQNALKDYHNNKVNVERQLKNIALAEKTYSETSLKYREGMATMSDLLQDQAGLDNAQNNYLNALYNFKVAELELMTLNGQIKTLYSK